jgi:signal transduction histidine kinase
MKTSGVPARASFLGLDSRQWQLGVVLALAYLACMGLSEVYLAHPSTLFPASGVALSMLFLEGIELWPFVYLAALLGSFLAGYPLSAIVLMPIAQTLQAVIGAYLLHRGRIDPLFRRSRDIYLLVGTVLLVALIVPTFGSLANALSVAFSGMVRAIPDWGLRYTGSVFCLLIITPFLLRWLAKPRFSRTGREIFETLLVFAILGGFGVLSFVDGVSTVAGIPTAYFILLPLFWIALTLRPRFVTLAMLLVSIVAIVGLYVGPNAASADLFSARLFQTEETLIVLAAIFFVMVSIEEDRRLSANLIRSHMALLENAYARISSESNAKNDFIAVLAHELRNPLAPVVSGIEYLKLTDGRSEKDIETLVMMEDRMESVRRILDDLLDISRISEGKIALRSETIDLETIIRRAILSTAHRLKERHQEISFTLPPERLSVEVDPVRIEQVFTNLLSNASKYSDSGDTISIVLRRRGEEAEAVVSDQGIGIPPETLEHIFTPFYQADGGARSLRGLGIGLALVQGFVEMHKGRVIAASEGKGRGSAFTVLLPLAAREAPPPASAPERDRRFAVARAALAPATSQLGPRVLIVDDKDEVASGIGRLLELKGCSISYAYTGQQALEAVAEMPPDIAILDIGLPDMDGYTLAKSLRLRGYQGRLIALTGYSTEDARKKGREAGFEHYLAKPASLADLKRVIPEIA